MSALPVSPDRFLELCSRIGLAPVLEQLDSFVVALDGDRHVLFWNRAIEEATGIARAQVLGRDGAEFVPLERDGELLARDGRRHAVQWTLVESEIDGAPISYAFGKDLTAERMSLQRKLQAERSAVASTLADGIAHEIRNPLNSAVLQLDVLESRIERGTADPSSLVSVIATVRDELRRAGDAAGALLGLAPARKLDVGSVDLNALVARVAEGKREQIEAANATLVLDLDEQVGAVELDQERIARLVANLIDNALEAATRRNRITVRSAAERNSVVVEIEDSGHGFAAGTPVFDAFFTTKEGRSGLGLAVAQRIAHDHGGTLEAVSERGRTRFCLALPRRPPQPKTSAKR